MALLEVKGLVKFYGRRAVVNGVDFEVNTGEVVGLLGPNGAGKTTSFRMATGQLTPNEGKVWFKGDEVNNLAMYERARLTVDGLFDNVINHFIFGPPNVNISSSSAGTITTGPGLNLSGVVDASRYIRLGARLEY